MARVVHAGDFHLDSAFRSLPEEQARLRRQERRELPGRLVDWANDHGAQLMLLAGDLFDSDNLYGQTAQELADALALVLGGMRVLSKRLTLAGGYDIGSLDSTKLDSCADSAMKRASDQAGKSYRGPVSVDRYGRRVPKPATGSIGLGEFTSSSTRIREAMTMLYERIVDPRLLVRRLTVIADDGATANELAAGKRYEQLDLFSRID